MRRVVRASWALAIAAIAGLSGRAGAAAPDSETVSQALGATLNGDGAGAEARLRDIPDTATDKVRRYRDCALRRLTSAEDDLPPRGSPEALTAALLIYRGYWREALRDRAGSAALEQSLLERLSLAFPTPRPTTFDALESALRGALAASGYHMLGGRTGPFRELMV
jgi:hypothetical protein